MLKFRRTENRITILAHIFRQCRSELSFFLARHCAKRSRIYRRLVFDIKIEPITVTANSKSATKKAFIFLMLRFLPLQASGFSPAYQCLHALPLTEKSQYRNDPPDPPETLQTRGNPEARTQTVPSPGLLFTTSSSQISANKSNTSSLILYSFPFPYDFSSI